MAFGRCSMGVLLFFHIIAVSTAWTTNGSTWTYMKLETKHKISLQVYDMEVDKYNPMKILFVSTVALYSTNGDAMTLLAGSSEGYKEGPAKKAKFRTIMSLVQKDERYVLLADRYNHCIREFDREKNVVSTFAGVCERMMNGSSDGNMRGEAEFLEPRDLELFGYKLYVAEKTDIRLIDLQTKQVSTLYNEPTTLKLPLGLVEMDGNLIITCNTEVVRYDVVTDQIKTLANHTWYIPKKLIKLDSEVLAIADGSGSVVFYNLTSNQTLLSICHGGSRHWEHGEADKCKLYGAYSILYHEKILYIGGTGQIMAIKLATSHSEIHESIYSLLKSTMVHYKVVVTCVVVGIIIIIFTVLIALLIRHRTKTRIRNRNPLPSRDYQSSHSSPEYQSRKPLLQSTSAESGSSGSASMTIAGSSSPKVNVKLKQR